MSPWSSRSPPEIQLDGEVAWAGANRVGPSGTRILTSASRCITDRVAARSSASSLSDCQRGRPAAPSGTAHSRFHAGPHSYFSGSSTYARAVRCGDVLTTRRISTPTARSEPGRHRRVPDASDPHDAQCHSCLRPTVVARLLLTARLSDRAPLVDQGTVSPQAPAENDTAEQEVGHIELAAVQPDRDPRRRSTRGRSSGSLLPRGTIPARDAGGASAMLWVWSTSPECRDRRWTG